MMPLKPGKKVNTAFTLDPKAVDIVDQNRGKQSRSSFVNDLILAAYGGQP